VSTRNEIGIAGERTFLNQCGQRKPGWKGNFGGGGASINLSPMGPQEMTSRHHGARIREQNKGGRIGT